MNTPWLDQAVASMVAAVPRNCSIDVRGTTRLLMLRAREDGVAVDPEDGRSAIVDACLRQGRSVSL